MEANKKRAGQEEECHSQSLAAGRWLADGLKWIGDGTGLAPAGGVCERGGGATRLSRGARWSSAPTEVASGACTSNSDHLEDCTRQKGMQRPLEESRRNVALSQLIPHKAVTFDGVPDEPQADAVPEGPRRRHYWLISLRWCLLFKVAVVCC